MKIRRLRLNILLSLLILGSQILLLITAWHEGEITSPETTFKWCTLTITQATCLNSTDGNFDINSYSLEDFKHLIYLETPPGHFPNQISSIQKVGVLVTIGMFAACVCFIYFFLFNVNPNLPLKYSKQWIIFSWCAKAMCLCGFFCSTMSLIYIYGTIYQIAPIIYPEYYIQLALVEGPALIICVSNALFYIILAISMWYQNKNHLSEKKNILLEKHSLQNNYHY